MKMNLKRILNHEYKRWFTWFSTHFFLKQQRIKHSSNSKQLSHFVPCPAPLISLTFPSPNTSLAVSYNILISKSIQANFV